MRLALVGEHASGKTSYLVATYGAIVNHAAGDARIIRLRGDVAFLNNGMEALAGGDSVRRTSSIDSDGLAIDIRLGDARFEIDAPDPSGELVKNTLNNRDWNPQLREMLLNVDAAILFLNAGRHDPGRPTEAVKELIEVGGDEQTEDQQDEESWSPKMMPSEVRTVDLLQAIEDLRPRPLPLAVAVSAWDLVQDMNPREWLEQRFPLLASFLSAKLDTFPHVAIGISAQGMEFGDTSDHAATRLAQDPWDRAFAVQEDGKIVTLEWPMVWLASEVGQFQG